MTMLKMTYMKTQDIIVNPQVRKVSDPKAQEELNGSVKAYGILVPLLVMASRVLLAGHRRLIAAIAAGLETVPVIITDRLLSDSEIRVIQLTENMHRADLSGYEKWLACSELMCMNPGWQLKGLAEALRMDPSSVTRMLSPSRCSPAWQEALKTGQVGISDCYAASKLPESEQAGLLAMKLGGASRDQIEKAGRKARNGTAPADRVSRIKCAVPGRGVTIAISGNGIGLDDMIEAMQDLLKKVRKAREQGWDCKTLERACRDEAKAK